MKDILKTLALPVSCALMIFLIVVTISNSCTENQETSQAAKPAVSDTIMTSAPLEWYCTPIAPVPTTSRAVGMRGKLHVNGSTIKIGFMGGTEAQRNLVKAAYASWKQSVNLNFEYPATGPYNIRVAFSAGSAWSYVGTDCNQISQNSPTLNFGFGYGAAEIAAGRSQVIEHEAGHSLGLLHEQQFPNAICWNEPNVIQDLSGPPNNWTLAMIRFNVLDYHNPANVILGVYDKASIMHYAIPARWTCSNTVIPGGTGITAGDRTFISTMYPGATPPPVTTVTITKAQRDNIYRLEQKAKLYTDSVLLVTKTVFGL